MRRYVWLLLIVFFICISCAPIGDIGGGTADELRAVPYRIVYNYNDLFRRESDLTVFTSYYGTVPIKDVNISIEDPAGSEPEEILVNEYWPMVTAGRKIIIVSYKNYSPVRYSIEVQDPNSLGGNRDDSDGDINLGGNIYWVWPGHPYP